jgi:hypothetical protein
MALTERSCPAVHGCAGGSDHLDEMQTRLQTLGWGTWALILALIALLMLAAFLVTPAS